MVDLTASPSWRTVVNENGVIGGIEVVRQKLWLGGLKLFESRL